MAFINLMGGMRFGIGVDSITQEARGAAIEYEGTTNDSGGQEVQASFELVESQESLMEHMNLSISVSARYMTANVDAKFNLANDHTVNQYSVFLLLKATVRNPKRYMVNPRLSADAERIYKNNPEQFRQIFGDTYIDEIYSGGRFFGLFQFETFDEKSRSDLSGELSASVQGVVAGGEIEAKFEKAFAVAERRSRVRLKAIMDGGAGLENPIDMNAMLELYRTFNQQVLEHPVDYQAYIKEFRYLPLPTPPTFAAQTVKRDILEQSGREVVEGIKLRSDIEFILRYPHQFESIDEARQKVLRAKLSQIQGLLPRIATRAQECADDITKCSLEGLDLPISAEEGLLPKRLIIVNPLDAKWQDVLAHDSHAAFSFKKEWLSSPIENYDEHNGGRYKLFNDGSKYVSGIFWHPNVDDGNAHIVYGAIFDEYLYRQGGCEGPLGFPISDEETLGALVGGEGLDRVSSFEHGALKWDAQTGMVSDWVSPLLKTSKTSREFRIHDL